MAADFLGLLSLGPDEEISSSPRDRAFSTSDPYSVEGIIALAQVVLANPAATPDERAAAQADIDRLAHKVRVGDRYTGRRFFIDGEIVHEKTNDRDVLWPAKRYGDPSRDRGDG
jgi:hypothetical protein